MSRMFDLTKIRNQRFPRVSGDEPVRKGNRPKNGEFSPRERG